DCYNTLGYFTYLRPRDVLPKAKAAAAKALELDDSLAEGLTSLAHVSAFFDRDWPSAERLYRQAIALNPGYANAHQRYGEFLTAMGRFEEGIAEGKRAQELDPLSPLITLNLAGIYFFARQYGEALTHYHKAIELDPYFVPVYGFLASFHAERGDYEQARAAIEKARSLVGGDSPTLNIHFAWLNALTGDQNDAERALRTLDELSKQEYVSPFEIASVYLALGQNDQVFMWLEKADEERIPWMVFLKVWPLYDRVRSDKRFVALLKKIGLEK
ncbi:MAG: tetratricopeptide repeat protein, partial [Dehalococcoidia bacterium]